MSIHFADVALSDDRYNQLVPWIDTFLPGLTKDLFAPVQRTRVNSISGKRAFVDMPTPNYPAPPIPRINTLYWPTGATRWATGLFLTNGEELKKILSVTYSDGS